MHKIPLNVECLDLLHSPIIINLKKLGTINEEVNDDKMDNDFTIQEINNYFSSSEFVSGCIFKKEQNSFTWIHEIELNGLYKKLVVDKLSFELCVGQSEWQNVFVQL